VSTKANAPNKSGRLLEPPSVRFHTVCDPAGFFMPAEKVAALHMYRHRPCPAFDTRRSMLISRQGGADERHTGT
ncbi:hypothetical protein, partial [Pseudomonas sp. H26/SER47-MNA-CIBAN-0231]|uniref:hypothetical protein n=1 Tax=Pseudomonas sp. H26/SER47-MNA-CIBAN-0231 TaxID=3140477 RepID=UPI003333A3C5